MLSLDVFLPRLLPSVPSCPEPLARQALLDAAIEFCEETGVIQVTTDPQAPTGGTAYDVDVPYGQSVVCTLRAWYGVTELTPCPQSVINNVDAFSATAANTGAAPHSFLEFAPGEVRLYPTPSVSTDALITFRVSTRPTRTATQVDNALFENWAEPIVAGALRRLHAIPDTPFFSDTHAERRAIEFLVGVSRARAETQRGRIRGSMTTQPRAFA